MDWSEVLDPELAPEVVLCERVPALHRERLEQFREFVTTSLIFSLRFTDSNDQFTIFFGPDDASSERGEMIDFPQATFRGEESKWRRTMALLSKLVAPADQQIDRYQGRLVVTEEIKRGFERFDGILEVTVTDLPDGDDAMSFDVVLNDYEAPQRAPRAELTVKWPLLEELAHGRIDPVEAARQVTVKGAMGLALDIGGFCMGEFDL